MISSKDIGLIVCLAVLGLIMTFSIGQVATMITGIPGANYIFTILHAIITSFSILIYEGRRWRFFAQISLFTFLIIPTYIGGVPFDLLSKSNLIVNAFCVDLLFNSFHGAFAKQNKLIWWAIIAATTFWVMNPFFGISIKSAIMYPPEYIARLIDTILLLFPLIVIESIAGGWIGYKIHTRVKKIPNRL